MGHFRCICGHQISDSMTPVPCMGHLLRDQDFETIDRLMADIDSYFEATRKGEREAWLRRHLGGVTGFSTDREVINELLCNHVINKSLTVHDCQQCGRLWVESDPDSNALLAYAPEGHVTRQLLVSTSPVVYDPTRPRDGDEAHAAKSAPDLHDRIRLFSMLELFLDLGLGLMESLDLCARAIETGDVGAATSQAVEALQTGALLSEAWADFPVLFPESTLASIRAAEERGAIGTLFGQLARELRFELIGVSSCARFLRAFSTALEECGDLWSALDQLAKSLTDERYLEFVNGLRNAHDSIGREMLNYPSLFPWTVVQLVVRAEINGDIVCTLARSADAMRRGLIA